MGFRPVPVAWSQRLPGAYGDPGGNDAPLSSERCQPSGEAAPCVTESRYHCHAYECARTMVPNCSGGAKRHAFTASPCVQPTSEM